MTKWTAHDILDALRAAYAIDVDPMLAEEWAMLTEVQLRAEDGNNRLIDALLVRNWASGAGHERIAVEIKVSRADYRNETDAKRRPAELCAHRTTYATPVGLIRPEELPPGWGLVEVYPDLPSFDAGQGRQLGAALARWRVAAPRRTPDCDADYLVSAVTRRASRAEERIRRAADEVATVPHLQGEVERLAGMLARRDTALRRERARARDFKALALAIEGMQECADCGEPVRYVERAWEHADTRTENRCRRERAEAIRARREAETGARYLAGFAGEVEPKALREALAVDESEAV